MSSEGLRSLRFMAFLRLQLRISSLCEPVADLLAPLQDPSSESASAEPSARPVHPPPHDHAPSVPSAQAVGPRSFLLCLGSEGRRESIALGDRGLPSPQGPAGKRTGRGGPASEAEGSRAVARGSGERACLSYYLSSKFMVTRCGRSSWAPENQVKSLVREKRPPAPGSGAPRVGAAARVYHAGTAWGSGSQKGPALPRPCRSDAGLLTAKLREPEWSWARWEVEAP